MNKIRQHINNYKYFTLSLIFGGFVFGYETGMTMAFFGVVVDMVLMAKNMPSTNKRSTNENSKTNNKFEETLIVWLLLSFGFSTLYVIIITIGTLDHIDGGPINLWINFTQPVTDQMAKYIPAINHYEKNLNEIGQKWRIGRLTHLIAILWIATLTFSILLFPIIKFGINTAQKVFFEAVNKDSSNYFIAWIKQFLLRIGLIILAGSVCYFAFTIVYYGQEISQHYVHKKVKTLMVISFMLFPFLFHMSIAAFISLFPITFISLKNIIRHQND